MSETFEKIDYTNFNFLAVSDIVSEWTKTVSLYKESYLKAEEDATFIFLNQTGLSGDFPKRFDEVMENLATSVNNYILELNSYIEDLVSKDESILENLPDPPREDEVLTDEEIEEDLGNDDITAIDDNVNLGVDNYEEQLSYFSQISFSDLYIVVESLNKIAQENNISINQLLAEADEAYGDKIKEMLLKNVKLSDTYRKMIEEGSSISLVTSLKALVNGEVKEAFGLDDDTELTLKSYLINIASDNNLEYSDLVGNEANSNVLKKALSSMKNINNSLSSFTKDDVQSRLLAIYDGNTSDMNVDDLSQNIIRSHIDVLSSLSDISYEELLTEPAYAEEMLDVTNRLQRTTLYAELLSNCNNSSSILSSLGNKEG